MMYIKIISALLYFGLIFSKVLFAQDMQTENLKNGSIINISESDINQQLQIDSANIVDSDEDKILHIPFGNSSTFKNTGDITILNSDEILKYDNVTTVNEALSSRIPGAYGTYNFRGLGNALILVDGFPRNITDVNMQEVEQITVIKDANSAILYGVQANRGIVMITTKRGKPKNNKISGIVETGIGVPVSYPKYLGSARYMELYNEALRNDGLADLYTAAEINGTISGTNPYKYPDVDYYNSTFLKNYIQRSRVETEFSGGTQNARFYANLGWRRTGDLLKMVESLNSDRLNFRSNLDFRINDFINTHVDIATIFNINNVLPSNFYSNASTFKPNYYPPLIDTSLIGNKNLIKAATIVQGGNLLGGTSLYQTNVYGDLLLGGYTKQYNIIGMFNVGVDFDLKAILEGLTFKTLTSMDFVSQFNETQNNTYAIYEPKWLINSLGGDSLSVTKIGNDKFTGTQGIANTGVARNFSLYGMLDFYRMFGTYHELSATILAYYDQYNASTLLQTDKNMHLGSRIYYVYNDKYIVNFSTAIVSSPKLSPDNRVSLSPSLALGYIISKEDFLKNNDIIDYLKLKVSAGVIKTDINLTRYFSYEDILTTSTGYAWGPSGAFSRSSVVFSNIANPDLSYEKRKELTIGTEMLLFDKSIWVEANYFRENKSDQFVLAGLTSTYPAFLGGVNPVENYNDDRYTGFEFGISWRKMTGDFSFDIGPSILILNSKVIKRDEFYENDYQYRTGKSTGAIFGLEALGLFQSQSEIDDHATQLFGIVKPGDIKYKDQNNDGIIDGNDEVQIGNSLASFVGGLTLRASYKNLTLFALASLRSGSQRTFSNSYYWLNGNVKYSEIAEGRWTPETAATASYPRLSTRSNPNNFRTSTFWLEENKLFSLSRLQITYDLPQSMASRLYTKNLSLYIRGSNILNIAENKDRMELNIGSEPQFRNYSIGLKAYF